MKINNNFNNIIKVNLKNRNNTIKPPLKNTITSTTIASITIPFLPPLLNTEQQNFKKTVEEDNYFQLKINPNTGKPYQADVFQKTAANYLYNGDNVIVTAPTGTGKTAIAEYIMTKNLKEGKKTFYTAPLKALSNEKYKDFCNIYGSENVGLITGDTKINKDAPIIVMTTEVYRNMVMSKFFGDNTNISNLKTIIFDELQYLGDIDRGGIWEQAIMFTPKNIQILSLSATAKNAETINQWLGEIKNLEIEKADCNNFYKNKKNKKSVWIDVPSENRHVPLKLNVRNVKPNVEKTNSQSRKKTINHKKTEQKKLNSTSAKPDLNCYIPLTKDLQEQNKLPAIYFIFNKKESNTLLKLLKNKGAELTEEKERKEIEEIINKYKEEDKYLGVNLDYEALLKGYAIHNAGLLPAQKSLIEELFQKKLVKVVIATETLSAGINMPAKTTIISTPRKPSSMPDALNDGKRNLSSNEFHQMAGRAGRRGIDTIGYCISLACNPSQNNLYNKLIETPSNDLKSHFKFDYSFIANYLSTYNDENTIRKIIEKSLYGYKNLEQQEELYKQYKILKNVLEKNEFIKEGKQTIKGKLLEHLNGFEQIPIISTITDKYFENLTPIELASIVSSLANIESKNTEMIQNKNKYFVMDNQNVADLVQTLNNNLQDYNEQVKELYNNKKSVISYDSAIQIYEWAKLNNTNTNSRENWGEIINGNLNIIDEGSLFKEITMTIELLKQMHEISNFGEKYSEDINDKKYYKNLKENIEQAIFLLEKEPVIYDNL